MLMFQVLVNVGMNLGIMPVTGITLPLMSYGGSSVLVTFIAIGLLQSIHVQAQLNSREQQGANRTVALRAREPTHPTTHLTDPSQRGGRSRCERAPRAVPALRGKETMKKKILVSVDRGETRVAVLEGKGDPREGARGPPQEGGSRRRLEGGGALRRAPRPPLDRRQHLQGQGRQRPARNGGRVRRHRPGAKRLPARRRDRPPGRQGRPEARPRTRSQHRRADQARPGDRRPGRQGPAEDQGRAAVDAALDRRPLPRLHAAGRRRRRLQAPPRRGAPAPAQADRGRRHRRRRRDRPHRRAGREEGGLRPRDRVPAPPERGGRASAPRRPRWAR